MRLFLHVNQIYADSTIHEILLILILVVLCLLKKPVLDLRLNQKYLQVIISLIIFAASIYYIRFENNIQFLLRLGFI